MREHEQETVMDEEMMQELEQQLAEARQNNDPAASYLEESIQALKDDMAAKQDRLKLWRELLAGDRPC